MKLSAFVVASLLLPVSCAPIPTDRPNLCQLAEKRGAYAGRRLTVEGYLLTSDHGTVVIDPVCDRGFAIHWREQDPRMRPMNALADEWVWHPVMARIRITGEVKWERSRHLPNAISWYLDLEDVHVLSARRLPDDDGSRYLTWLEGPSPEPFRPSR